MSSASDLVSHLTPCEYQITFHGLVFTVPALDAVGWLKIITAEPFSLYAIFPELCGRDAVDMIEDMLWEEHVTVEQVERAGLEVISAAGDRPWWEVMKLIGFARSSWSILHVPAPPGTPLAGWLDDLWTKIVIHCDPKKLTSVRSELTSAPKGFEAEVNFDAEEQAFLNAMNAVMR